MKNAQIKEACITRNAFTQYMYRAIAFAQSFYCVNFFYFTVFSVFVMIFDPIK